MSPTERIYWPFLMCHEHVTRALVQPLQIADTPSRTDGIFHDAPLGSSQALTH
jgi:hypothetical protein